MTEIKDWRGTLIEPGQLAVWGAGVGRSIQMCEGIVDSFTDTGRVRVAVTRRSYSSGSKEIVHIGADRLTIVDALPETDVPTQRETHIEKLRASVKRSDALVEDIHYTHREWAKGWAAEARAKLAKYGVSE